MWTTQVRGFLPPAPRDSNGGLTAFDMPELQR